MSKKAIFICGPTAIGKTSLAIEIAKWLKTEIISFDSRQFYKELKIGAAPPSSDELSQVKHHFIAHLSVKDEFNAGDFEQEALSLMEKLWDKHECIVLVGGSGLYMKVLTDGFDEMPTVTESTREQLNNEFQKFGLQKLQKELQEADPDYYNTVDLNNPQRLIRALEIIRETGKTYSSYRKASKVIRTFRSIKIGLEMNRQELYERINTRVDLMLEAGLLEEVQSLIPFKDKNSLQTVGYRELFPVLDGKISLQQGADEVKKNSRRYAKRQLTWFRREENMNWFSPFDLEGIKTFLQKELDHN